MRSSGDHIIDAKTGRRCQIEEVLADGALLRVRFEDGHSDTVEVRPTTDDELEDLRARELDPDAHQIALERGPQPE
jgi:hypothetical protein